MYHIKVMQRQPDGHNVELEFIQVQGVRLRQTVEDEQRVLLEMEIAANESGRVRVHITGQPD